MAKSADKLGCPFYEGSLRLKDFAGQNLFHELMEDQPTFAAALHESRGFQFGRLLVGRPRPERAFFFP